jgi:hypothetical protein
MPGKAKHNMSFAKKVAEVLIWSFKTIFSDVGF